jgi:hypothetical protein
MADIYSRNRLKNGDAEAGTMENWTYDNATVVVGGPAESARCFQIGSIGYMKQTIPATTQPPDVKVGGIFLPEYPTESPVKKIFIKVTHHYGDGSKDEHVVPCVESGGEI